MKELLLYMLPVIVPLFFLLWFSLGITGILLFFAVILFTVVLFWVMAKWVDFVDKHVKN